MAETWSDAHEAAFLPLPWLHVTATEDERNRPLMLKLEFCSNPTALRCLATDLEHVCFEHLPYRVIASRIGASIDNGNFDSQTQVFNASNTDTTQMVEAFMQELADTFGVESSGLVLRDNGSKPVVARVESNSYGVSFLL